MAAVTLKTAAGKDAGSLELNDEFFGIQPNVPVMHQVVTAQLAARRAGTQSTKTRAEVSGGGKKPFKQKGTGNARQGSTRSPQFSGGGVALGPKPRKYDQKTPKKMIRLALRSALSDRAAEGKVVVVDSWSFDTPKTKDAIAALDRLGIDGKALVVVDIDDTNTIKSFLNLQQVQLIEAGELNAYDVLCNEYIVFSQATLPGGEAAEAAKAKASTKKSAKQTVPADAKLGFASVAAADDSAATAAKADADEPTAEQIGDGSGSLPKGAVAANEDGSSPFKTYAIKGNADSGYYHRPGTAFYDRTVAEFWFRDEEAAKAAGFELPPSQRDEDEADAGTKVSTLADIASADEPRPDQIGDGSGKLPKGAVAANEDGSSPFKTYTIKGNADSGYYHTTESPYYERTVAEFWFRDEDAAKNAGFELPPSLADNDGEES